MASSTASSTSSHQPDETDCLSPLSSDREGGVELERGTRTGVSNQESLATGSSGTQNWTKVTRRRSSARVPRENDRAYIHSNRKRYRTQDKDGNGHIQTWSNVRTSLLSKPELGCPARGPVPTRSSDIRGVTEQSSAAAALASKRSGPEPRRYSNPASLERPLRAKVLSQVAESAQEWRGLEPRRVSHPASIKPPLRPEDLSEVAVSAQKRKVSSVEKHADTVQQLTSPITDDSNNQETGEPVRPKRPKRRKASASPLVSKLQIENGVPSTVVTMANSVEQTDNTTSTSEIHHSSDAAKAVKPQGHFATSNPLVSPASAHHRRASNKCKTGAQREESFKDLAIQDQDLKVHALSSILYHKSLPRTLDRRAWIRKIRPLSNGVRRRTSGHLQQLRQASYQQESKKSFEEVIQTPLEVFPMFGFPQEVCDQYAGGPGSLDEIRNTLGVRLSPKQSVGWQPRSSSRAKWWPELRRGDARGLPVKFYVEYSRKLPHHNSVVGTSAMETRSGIMSVGADKVATWTPIKREELLDTLVLCPNRPKQYIPASASQLNSRIDPQSVEKLCRLFFGCQIFRPRDFDTRHWKPKDFVASFITFYHTLRAPDYQVMTAAEQQLNTWREGLKPDYENLEAQWLEWLGAILRLPASMDLGFADGQIDCLERPAVALFMGKALLIIRNMKSTKFSDIFLLKGFLEREGVEEVQNNRQRTPAEVQVWCEWARLGL